MDSINHTSDAYSLPTIYESGQSFPQEISPIKIEIPSKKFLEQNSRLLVKLFCVVFQLFLEYSQKTSFQRSHISQEYEELSQDLLLGFQKLPPDCQAYLLYSFTFEL